jgi:hypothetical protein
MSRTSSAVDKGLRLIYKSASGRRHIISIVLGYSVRIEEGTSVSSEQLPQSARKPKLVITMDELSAVQPQAAQASQAHSRPILDLREYSPVETVAPLPSTETAGEIPPLPAVDGIPPQVASSPRPPSAASQAPNGPAPSRRPNYAVCAVRDVLDGPFGPEDGFFLPVPALEKDTVILESRDGTNVRRILCKGISVRAGEQHKRLLRATDIRAQVLVTDARITVACSKFDKGGGWWGIGAGALVAIPLNAGSKALAARRRRGRMFVGQIRYPWISAVYAQNKGGLRGVEMLRVTVKSGGRSLWLDLTLPSDVDATAVAAELIRRTAQFRLAHERPMEDKERAALTELSNIPPLVWRRDEKKMVGHSFPTFWPVGDKSARFGLPGLES